MDVLVIPTWYPNGTDKLMGIYHKEFTESLNDYGITANMLFIDRQRLNNPLKYLFGKKKIIDEEKNYKIYIYKMLNLGSISFRLQLKNYTKKMDQAFKDYIKYNKVPDLIHAHVTIPAGYAACLIGKKYNIPVIVTEHSSYFERFYEKQFKKYSDFVFQNSTYSTVSNYMKKIALKHTDKCEVIPNLVDIVPFKNNVIRKVKDDFKIVIICALREGKRIDIALKAMAILVKKNIKVHLDIVGDGFYENYYKQVCNELKLDRYVTFLGRKENKFEIAEILKKENALLISSEIESFGIPGIEAMAAGLPVISTDCLGPTEYVNSKTGLICKVNDPNDMASSIIKLINNYDKYDKLEIEKEANKYSKEVIMKDVINLYKKINNN